MKQAFLLPEEVLLALSMLNEKGFSSYVVGGCVRDFLMGIPPHDFDLCTDAPPEKIKEVFKAFPVILTGEKHGTVTVVIHHMPLEITTFRKDGDYLDGRHPNQVSFTPSLEEDLKRRDFTVNAMAYHPDTGLRDPFFGQKDIEEKILRCVGEPECRFHEDALRILRALRFAARLEFRVEEKTKEALHLLHPALCKISQERIASELTGLLMAKGAKKILWEFSDVFKTVLPECLPIEESTLDALSRLPFLPPLRWACLLVNASHEDALSALHRLKMSNHLTDTVEMLLRYKNLSLHIKEVKKLLCSVGKENAFLLYDFLSALYPEKKDDILNMQAETKRVLEKGECFCLSMLSVTGKDLKQAGFSGKEIGDMLHLLLDKVLLNELPNEKEALLNFIRRK